MKKILLIVPFFFSFLVASAQAERELTNPLIENGPRFFICIIAGVILAFAFQLLLTMISVAAGITAVGDIEKKANSNSSGSSSDSSDSDSMNTGQKISTGIGIWTMITASVSLFFASLLAVKLSLIGVNFIGVTLGLVIWASFFMLMTYLEVNAVSSFLGGMISTVKNGISNVFGRSSESEAKAVAKSQAQDNAHALRKEFENLFDNRDVDKKIEEYIDKLQPQQIDINHIKNEIKSLITDLQVREKAAYFDEDTIKKLIVEEAESSTLSQKDKEAVKNHVKDLKNIAQGDGSNEEKVKQGIENLTNADREQIEKYQAQIKEMFQNTEKEELQPENLERDIQKILDNPREATSIIKAKASAIDRQTLVKIISAREDVNEEEAKDYVRKVENTLQKIEGYFSSKSSEADGQKEQMKGQKDELQTKLKNIFSQKQGEAQYNFNRIKSDFTSLFSSAGSSGDLKYKLENYNKEQMMELVTTRTSIPREKAEPVVEKIIEARDTVLQKAAEVETKVKRKVEEVKQAALRQAEETRAAAVTAAWWLVATALVSGIASALGGMIALDAWVF